MSRMRAGRHTGRTIVRLMTAGVITFSNICSAQAQTAVMMHSVRALPQQVDVSRNDTTRINWYLTGNSRLDVFLCDMDGRIVRRILSDIEVKAGNHSVAWDGRDDRGDFCPDGLYVPILKAHTDRRGYGIYNPTLQPWGEVIEPASIAYDAGRQKIVFTLERTALCLLRIGETNGGPFYQTLFGWEMRDPGTYEVEWNGFDPSGLVNVAECENFAIFLDAFAIPHNAIVLRGSTSTFYRDESSYPRFALLPPRGGRTSVYALHIRSLRNDLPFVLHIDKVKRKVGDLSVLSGSVQLFISAAADLDPASLRGERLEIFLFVDGMFQYELPAAGLPIRTRLETGKYVNGEHILTVNLRTNRQRCGTYTMKVKIEN